MLAAFKQKLLIIQARSYRKNWQSFRGISPLRFAQQEPLQMLFYYVVCARLTVRSDPGLIRLSSLCTKPGTFCPFTRINQEWRSGVIVHQPFYGELTCKLYIGTDSEVKRALLPPLAPHDRGGADVAEHGGGAETSSWALTRRWKQLCGRKSKQAGDGWNVASKCISSKQHVSCFWRAVLLQYHQLGRTCLQSMWLNAEVHSPNRYILTDFLHRCQQNYCMHACMHGRSHGAR